jgi:chemotaxis protein histidine kinase CheA
MSSSHSPGKKKPRTSLKDRLQKPGGITADEAIKRGQEAVNEMRGDFKVELTQNIAKLTRLYKNKPKVYAPKDEWWQELRRKLTDMRGVAGTFDYALVTVICDNLLDYLDNVEDDLYFDQIFGEHIAALQNVAINDTKGKGGPEDRERVKKLRAKVIDRKENAPFKREAHEESDDNGASGAET